MGPAILLDKSAVEAIGMNALHVQSEFFYTTIAPVLVWEICGDIQKAREGNCEQSRVRSLAAKAAPLSSVVNADWRLLCLQELSGVRVYPSPPPRPVPAGMHYVPLPEGGYAGHLGPQPEKDALLRWHFGKWSDSDIAYAEAWRSITTRLDLELMRRAFGPPKRQTESLDELKAVFESTAQDPSLQYSFLRLLTDQMSLSRTSQQQLLNRWRGNLAAAWQTRCPYARHCFRTFLLFYLALSGNVISTSPTNRVDLEYLLYLPFASFFISGDSRTHGRLAPLLLRGDQEFISASAFRDALQAQADSTQQLREAGVERESDDYEPAAESLIRTMWMKAWGHFRRQPSSRASLPSSESAKSIAERFADLDKIVQANPDRYPPRRPWPSIY